MDDRPPIPDTDEHDAELEDDVDDIVIDALPSSVDTSSTDRLSSPVTALFSDRIARTLAVGAAPGRVIEEAANAVRSICPGRGVAVWYRQHSGEVVVQAAGVDRHLTMISEDADSPFWQRAITESKPNYRITFKAHREDLGPTSVWCVPVVDGPVSGDLTFVVVGRGDDGPPPTDIQAAIEHVARLVGVGLDRQHLVDRLAIEPTPDPDIAPGEWD